MDIKIGCHVSIAGGVFKAPKNAADLGCETFQIFSRSPQGGPAPKLTPDIVAQFRDEMAKYGFSDFVIHAPYFINFGSPKPATYHGSISIVRGELDRGTLLGARFVMFHPGSLKDNTENGFKQAQEGIAQVLEGYEGTTELLIEISAGAGEVVGDTFEELAELIAPLKKQRGFGGICYDTQHAFASGYDIRTPQAAAATLKKFDEVIGLEFLRMSHVNDSKVEFGSHKDRHEHVGDGFIGTEGLGAFVGEVKKQKKHLKSSAFTLILETEHDKVEQDIRALQKLRGSL